MELTTLSTALYLSFLEIIWLVNILEDSNPFLVPYENVGTVWLLIVICSVRYMAIAINYTHVYIHVARSV